MLFPLKVVVEEEGVVVIAPPPGCCDDVVGVMTALSALVDGSGCGDANGSNWLVMKLLLRV